MTDTMPPAVPVTEAPASPSYTYTRALLDGSRNVAFRAYSGSKDLSKSLLPAVASELVDGLEKEYVAPLVGRFDKACGSMADVVDQRMVSPVITYSVDKAQGAKSYTEATVRQTAADVANRPVVKDLITPATTAVMTGLLDASDIVVDYAMPADAEQKEEEAAVDSETPKFIAPRTLALSRKLRRRLASRATKAIEARKQAVVHTNLFQYSKHFLDDKVVPLIPDSVADTWEASEGAASTARITALAKAVLATYTVEVNGMVQPYFVAVSNYGEHFMERVYKYEMPAEGADAAVAAANMDEIAGSFIERVAQRFIEPALVRVVAVFLVLGDEVKQFRKMTLEPAIKSAWAQMDVQHAQQNAKLVYDAVSRTIESTVATASGAAAAIYDRTSLDSFYSAAVEEYMLLDTDGDGKVSIEEFRVGVQKRLGEEYSENMAPLVLKAYNAARQTKVARALLSVQTGFADLKAAAYAEYVALDTDGDSSVSFAEFQAGVQTRLGNTYVPGMTVVLKQMFSASQAVQAAQPAALADEEFVDAVETD